MQLSDFTVTDYSPDVVINHIRYKTGWGRRSDIISKPQLSYIFSYLESDANPALTAVFENEYIDKHYLQDYAEYYVRCFNKYPRFCSRIHFFSQAFTESDFVSFLENGDASSCLQNNYLGYVVIRPIPSAYFAKICLQAPSEITQNENTKTITQKNKVSLFGIQLNVDTVPILEQDKIVAACATSALWTLLCAHGHINQKNLPSPSAITKAATLQDKASERTFPNHGLQFKQIGRCLKHYGLEPSIHLFQSNDINERIEKIKELVYAYTSMGIPTLLGGSIFEIDSSSENELKKHIGKHLVCISGFKTSGINGGRKNRKNELNFKAHSMKTLYVHDDRRGPYSTIHLDIKEFDVKNLDLEEYVQPDQKTISGVIINSESECFIPDVLIIGTYHKVRITYENILLTCRAIYNYITYLDADIKDSKSNKDTVQYDEIISGNWEIKLSTNKKVKSSVISSPSFIASNGNDKKIDFITKSLPKYIWQCRVYCKDKVYLDFLFDATEVPQGMLFIGYISYSMATEKACQYLNKSLREHLFFDASNGSTSIAEDDKVALHPICKRLEKPEENSLLNSLYGRPCLPRRSLKDGEGDFQKNIVVRQDLYYIRTDDKFTDEGSLNQDKKYIWAITIDGDFVYGEDIEKDQGFQGHPTLIDGGPARIGGELFYNTGWKLNSKSRAYSSHLANDSTRSMIYLENIKKKKFANAMWLELTK